MARPLKVYGGWLFHSRVRAYRHRGHQVTAIIAAPSKAAALRAIHDQTRSRVSTGEFNNYWSETGNARQVADAMARPGVVLYARLDDPSPVAYVAWDEDLPPYQMRITSQWNRRTNKVRYAYLLTYDDPHEPDYRSTFRFHTREAAWRAGVADAKAYQATDDD